MVKNRAIGFAFSLALAASLTLGGTAFAGTRGVSVLNVWGTMGVWGTYANFFSQWSATYWHAEGKTVWLIENLDMDAILQNGKNCSSEICVAWAYGATARFYNSAGVQVGVITPPADNCYASAYSSNDRAWSRCKRYGVEIASSATTMKLTWTVSVQRRDGIWLQAWSAARTVTLANT